MICTDHDLPYLKAIGHIVATTLRVMQSHVKAGITTLELDQIGEDVLTSHGARSAPRHVYQFPGATCICVNNETAHGIPSHRVLQDGDLINIDVSAVKDGYFSDTGASMVVGNHTPKRLATLLKTGQMALTHAMAVAKAGTPINHIGKAIQKVAHTHGYSVIRNLGSHGIGKTLHDEPTFIAHFFDPNDRRILKENQVITIEPFVSLGGSLAKETGDGWTLATKPNQLTVQFEHTLIITPNDPVILSVPSDPTTSTLPGITHPW